jgi:hypothetical protein
MQPTPQDNQPMSKHRVLSFKPQLRLAWRGQDGQNETEQPDHSASLGDSITASTQIRFSVHTAGWHRPLIEEPSAGSLRPESQRRTVSRLRLRHFREKSRAREYAGAKRSRWVFFRLAGRYLNVRPQERRR